MAKRYRTLILEELREKLHIIVIATIIGLAVLFRISTFGDPRLSIATLDTYAFIRSSKLPILSLDFFTSNRPATIALVYKLLEPDSGYDLIQISRPAISGTTHKAFQSGLDRVVLTQRALAILSWCTLAIVVSRQLNNPFIKVLGVLLILAFAFSPQLADWDSVLMSESIALSLFALVIALTLELAIRLAKEGYSLHLSTRILIVVWLGVMILWIFSRDSNVYVLPVTIAFIVPLTLLPRFRRQLHTRVLLGICTALTALFLIHNLTLYKSDRWVNPFLNNMIYNVFPHEDRLAFFEKHGMPVSDELLAFRTSRGNERGFFALEDFMEWVISRGSSTYVLFLIDNPRWTLATLVWKAEFLFSENIQSYFRETPDNIPFRFKPFGDMLHPTSSSIIALDIFLTVSVLAAAIKRHEQTSLALGWMFVWLLVGEFVLLFVSYHGDSLGVIRHALVAVVPLRLSTWLLTVFVLDNLVPTISADQISKPKI